MPSRHRRASNRSGAYRMELVAWGHPETQLSSRHYRRHAWTWLCGGTAGTVGSPWIGITADASDRNWLGSIMAVLWVLCISASLFGICMTYNSARMRSRLRRYPWKPYRVNVLPAGLGGPVVQLRPKDSNTVFIQSVVALNFRWRYVRDSDTLWFCGVPGQGGVLARPGGAPLLWARPVRIAPLRHWHERVPG